MASIIQKRTGANSIAGQVALPELLHWVANAEAVITNDTMAAHMGASLGKPTVIIANGVNYVRFSEYFKAGINHVITIYPEVVNRRRRHFGDGPYAYSETITADIASIKATTVFNSLKALLEAQTTAFFDRCTPQHVSSLRPAASDSSSLHSNFRYDAGGGKESR
jgi:ADP-heptose:LPS heptosyltransferase